MNECFCESFKWRNSHSLIQNSNYKNVIHNTHMHALIRFKTIFVSSADVFILIKRVYGKYLCIYINPFIQCVPYYIISNTK